MRKGGSHIKSNYFNGLHSQRLTMCKHHSLVRPDVPTPMAKRHSDRCIRELRVDAELPYVTIEAAEAETNIGIGRLIRQVNHCRCQPIGALGHDVLGMCEHLHF